MSTILDGYLKAIKNIAEAPGKEQARRKPRFTYEPYAMALHPKPGMKRELRAKFDDLIAKLKVAPPNERGPIIAELGKLPIERVRVMSQVRLERSKYSGRAIKALGGRGGKKEQARAAKRAVAIKGMTPLATNDNASLAQTEAA
jgi:hypothetical protein